MASLAIDRIAPPQSPSHAASDTPLKPKEKRGKAPLGAVLRTARMLFVANGVSDAQPLALPARSPGRRRLRAASGSRIELPCLRGRALFLALRREAHGRLPCRAAFGRLSVFPIRRSGERPTRPGTRFRVRGLGRLPRFAYQAPTGAWSTGGSCWIRTSDQRIKSPLS